MATTCPCQETATASSLDRNALGMAVAMVAGAAAVAGVAAVAHLGTELPTPCACGPSSLLACLHVSLEWLLLPKRRFGLPQQAVHLFC